MTFRELYTRLAPAIVRHHASPSMTAEEATAEAQATLRWVLEERFELSLTDIASGKVSELSADDLASLEKIMLRLEQGEPVQYVLGEATFCGRKFTVKKGVLIPRPETEQLCEWIQADHDNAYCALQPPAPLQVLDIGTGSGCIAVTLALGIDNAHVAACDISGDALLIARENAHRLQARIDLSLHVILAIAADAERSLRDADRWDIIVSNPPYIAEKERADMADNVLQYEPEEALFVPDDDALRFYKAIAVYALTALKAGGELYFEINPTYAAELKAWLAKAGFIGTEIRNDAFGRQRMLKTRRPWNQ